MVKDSNKETKVIHVFFRVMVFVVFAFFLLGEIVLPEEEWTGKRSGKEFHAQWYQVLEDGQHKMVKVPGRTEPENGKVVIETQIPRNLGSGTWFCFRSSQQDMKIYIAGELRETYSTKDTRLFGKNSVSGFVFVKVKNSDPGKMIRVETVTDSSYAGMLNTVYYGGQMGIWVKLAKIHFLPLLIAIILLVLAVVCIVTSILLRICYKKEVELEYLGWGVLFTAIWLISESKLRQIFFHNISLVSYMSFLVVLLMPFPFLFYMNNVQEYRYRKGYYVLYIIAAVDMVLCIGLQITNIADFLEMMQVMCIILLLSVAYIFLTIIGDIRKRIIRKYRPVAIGFVGMMLAAVVEILAVLNQDMNITGVPLCMGLIFLLMMAVVKTVKDVLVVEKENHRAIMVGESKTNFLANMSHEIRTPINTVLGMNELILNESQEESILEYAENIDNAGRMLLALVNDVLDFSKIESGRLELTEVTYQLSSLLNDVILLSEKKRKEKNLELYLNIDETLPATLQGDSTRIKQILTNLMTNALKYTQEGSITFSAQGIWSQEGEFCLKMSVADTGIGIREEDIGKLFSSFTRLDEKRNLTIEGTGLGLTITKQIIDKMHGNIKVQSVYGSGTMFTVILPQVVIDKQPMGNLQQAYEQEKRTRKTNQQSFHAPDASVLVVDDNAMNLAVVRGKLKKTQMKLDMASGGKECLELCRNQKYDLILMDHMMPEMDGIETLHALKEETITPNTHTPVIALTANAIAGVEQMYLQEGFVAYLSKPLDTEKLLKVIAENLNPELVFYEEGIFEPVFEEYEINAPAVQGREEPKETVLIDTQSAMSFMDNDEELYQEVLSAYCTQGKKYVQELPKHVEEGDWKKYQIIVHSIKSTSLSIGAKELSEMAKEQEFAAKEGREQDIRKAWDEFYARYKRVLEAANELLREDVSSDVVEKSLITLEEYKKVAYLLKDAIDNFEMSVATKLVEKLKEVRVDGQPENTYEILGEIKNLVDDFAYDEATVQLTELMKQMGCTENGESE